jgi:hypothetical protein
MQVFDDGLRLLLLDPMPRAGHQAHVRHACKGPFAHHVQGTGHLICAPVALAGDKHRRHVNCLAREQSQVRDEMRFEAGPVPVEATLKAGAFVFFDVDSYLGVWQPLITGDLGRRRRKGGTVSGMVWSRSIT